MGAPAEGVFVAVADPTRWRVLNLLAEVRYTVRTEPLGETARWMARLAAQWDARLATIKRLAEEDPNTQEIPR
jgi:hypothetical protein